MSNNDDVNVQFRANMDDLISGLSAGTAALTQAFEALTERTNEAGKALQEKLGGGANEAAKSIEKTHEETLNVGHALEEMKGKLNAAFEATGIAIAYELLHKVFEEIERIADNAERVLQTALSFRATTVELQGLEAIAIRSGGSIEVVRRGLAQLSNAMTSAREGSEAARLKLDSLGITMADLSSPSFTVIDAMVRLAQSGASDAEILSLFGARAVALLPTLRALKGGLDELHKAANDVNSLNKEQLEVLEKFKERVETLDLKWENLKARLLTGVLPAFEAVLDEIDKVSKALQAQQEVGESQAKSGWWAQTIQHLKDLEEQYPKTAAAMVSYWDKAKTAMAEAARATAASNPFTKAVADMLGQGMFSGAQRQPLEGLGGHGAIGTRPEKRPASGRKTPDPETDAERNKKFMADMKEMEAEIAQLGLRQREVTRQLGEENLADFSRQQQIMLERKRDNSLAQVDLEMDSIRQQLQLGTIRVADAVQQEQDLALRRFQIQQTYYDHVKALVAQHQEDVDKADAGIAAAANARAKEMQRTQSELALGIQRRWQEILQPISQAFDESIKGMIRGTLTFSNAMRNMGQSIVLEFVSACVKMLTKWIATEIAKTGASIAGSAARQTAEQAGHKQGLAASAASAIKEIANSAYVTMANVYRSVSAIPYVGWILAPIAAVAAGAAVLAFGGSIASAAGGWEVPKDQMAQVHKDEMVLPANISKGLKQLISGDSAGGGGNHFHSHFNVAAMDAGDVQKFFRKNGASLARSMREQAQRFNPAVSRT